LLAGHKVFLIAEQQSVEEALKLLEWLISKDEQKSIRWHPHFVLLGDLFVQAKEFKSACMCYQRAQSYVNIFQFFSNLLKKLQIESDMNDKSEFLKFGNDLAEMYLHLGELPKCIEI